MFNIKTSNMTFYTVSTDSLSIDGVKTGYALRPSSDIFFNLIYESTGRIIARLEFKDELDFLLQVSDEIIAHRKMVEESIEQLRENLKKIKKFGE